MSCDCHVKLAFLFASSKLEFQFKLSLAQRLSNDLSHGLAGERPRRRRLLPAMRAVFAHPLCKRLHRGLFRSAGELLEDGVLLHVPPPLLDGGLRMPVPVEPFGLEL